MKPKIIFWINAFLLPFCLAHNLQKKYDADYYAIFDITNKPKNFFQSQQFVQFEKMWFYHDHIKKLNQKPDTEYLEKFEKKYGINLWSLAINERIFYRFNRIYKFSTEEILLILEQECKLFEKIIDEVKPDFLITHDPPLHHHRLFYELCMVNGVKPLITFVPRIGTSCFIAESERSIAPENLSDIQGKGRTIEQLQNLRKTSGYSVTTMNFLKGRNNSYMDQFTALKEFVLNSDSSNTETHYSYFGRNKPKVIIDALKFSSRKKSRTNFIDKNLEKNPDLASPFIYFPMNVDEEMNLLQYAPFYTNQIEVIRHISKSLPINYTLYVKEHPGQKVRAWRTESDYREIMDIPNVHLIHPSFSAEKLYENCSLVITIRGTSGLDAAFYKKPSIIFGDMLYSLLPSVYRLKSLEDLPNAIRQSLQKEVIPSDLDKYLTLIENNSFDFDIAAYENKELKHFYAGGILVDVEISSSTMKSFLDENKSIFDTLSSEYVKKLSVS